MGLCYWGMAGGEEQIPCAIQFLACEGGERGCVSVRRGSMLTSADGPATRPKAGLWGIVVLVGAWACTALSSLSVLESRSLIACT